MVQEEKKKIKKKVEKKCNELELKKCFFWLGEDLKGGKGGRAPRILMSGDARSNPPNDTRFPGEEKRHTRKRNGHTRKMGEFRGKNGGRKRKKKKRSKRFV